MMIGTPLIDSPSVPVRKAYLDIGEGQIHGHFVGDGEHTVVFLHQTASSGLMFYRVMARLADMYRMIALDTPGFGGSFDPSGMPNMTDYAGWIGDAIEGLGLGDVHLVGSHTGACISAELAVSRDWVASVALIGPPVLTPDERAAFRRSFGNPTEIAADGSHLMAAWDYVAKRQSGGDLAFHHREAIDNLRGRVGSVQSYAAVWDQDFSSLYEQIRQPIAIMSARGGVLWDYFERAKSMRPDAHAYELGGAGYSPDLDPDGCVRALTDFWSRTH
jgi:pimeloyl-ACP methyl ester carboxylesterase